MSVLAIRGGNPAVTQSAPDIGIWPLITDEDRQAVLGVLEARSMSLLDVTREFENDYAFCADCRTKDCRNRIRSLG